MSDLIKPSLHHVTIKTSRLAAMLEWYGIVVGTKAVFQDEHNAWTTNDAANHRLAFLAAPGLEDDPDKIKHNGLHHFAFEYDSFADLMSSYDRMRKQGITPALGLNHGSTVSIYYLDPEGNYVELQSDNFGDWKLSTEFIRSSEDFRSNPIGTYFDPARVFAAYTGGRTIEDLYPAMRKGEFKPDVIPGLGVPDVVEIAVDVA